MVTMADDLTALGVRQGPRARTAAAALRPREAGRRGVRRAAAPTSCLCRAGEARAARGFVPDSIRTDSIRTRARYIFAQLCRKLLYDRSSGGGVVRCRVGFASKWRAGCKRCPPLSPHISPAICCGRRSAAICGVCSRRAARRTVKYASAALRSQPPHLATRLRLRDESR